MSRQGSHIHRRVKLGPYADACAREDRARERLRNARAKLLADFTADELEAIPPAVIKGAIDAWQRRQSAHGSEGSSEGIWVYEICDSCGGSGKVYETIQDGPRQYQKESPCTKCQGEG